MWISDGAMRRASNEEAGYTGKGGKLRLSRPVLTKKKPYDRPLPPGALDRPLSSGHLGPAPSLPARLVGSASNLITSSASYLFDSFFKRRRTLWIGNDVPRTAGTDSADMERKEDQVKEDVSPLQEGPAPVALPEEVEGEDLDLAQVEQILKQQFLSREEVKRLTNVLQARAHGGNAAGSVTEAQEKIKQVGEEPSPVQLAKAYMGKRTSISVSTTPHRQSTPDRYGAVVAGSSLGVRIKEDAFERSSAQNSRAYSASAAASVRMLKRRLIAHDEDTVTPRGPTRRVRQKMTIMASSSPYIRQVTAATGPLRTPSTPLLQASERTEKIMEALKEPVVPSKGKSVEEPMAVAGPGLDQYPPESSKARETVENHSNKEFIVLPTSGEPGVSSYKPAGKPVATTAPEPVVPSKGKSVEEPMAGPGHDQYPPESSKARETLENHSNKEFIVLPTSGEPGVSSYKPAGKPVATTAPEPVKKSVAGSLTASTLEPPIIIPEKTKGFHMSAFFEDSSSDEEAGPPVKALMSREAQQAKPLISKEAAVTKQPFATTLALEKSTPVLPSTKPFPVVFHVPSASEKESPPSTVSSVSTTISAAPSVPPSLPAAAPAVVSLPAGTVAVAPLLSVVAIEPSSVMQKIAAAEGVAAEARDASPVTATQPPFQPPPSTTRGAEAPISVARSMTALAAASKLPAALVTLAASVSPVGSVALMAVPETVPVVAQAGVESPSADKQAELDTMATEPMTEEPDSSIVCSAAPSFLFGSVPTGSSTTVGQTLPFGSGAASAPFSFPMQASTPSAVSSSVQSPFSSQSSSAAGQLFTFGASGSSPFSGSIEPSFPFGSSAASSASSIFPATSSAPMTFPATPASPSSFTFGAHAASSSLTSSMSVFGSQTTPTASTFAGTGAPAFAFSAPPTSSGTPTPPTFQFGGAGAGASSMASSPSFGGQSFTYGGQPTVAAASPFAQSGASNAAPFQPAATSSQPVFSSGASATSTFSFGAQPAASPFPFTFGGQPSASPTGQPFGFGGQPGASPSGQPFGFGGQPGAPAQSPFTLPGSTGQSPFGSAGASGMDFGGGFSLGAAGGEKSGRKFIKAKRIGGAKRGK